jgi:hypothetical protein
MIYLNIEDLEKEILITGKDFEIKLQNCISRRKESKHILDTGGPFW